MSLNRRGLCPAGLFSIILDKIFTKVEYNTKKLDGEIERRLISNYEEV